MKIYLLNQEQRFREHLNELKNKPVMPFLKTRLKEKNSFIKISSDSLASVSPDALFDYRIFPTRILTHLSQWKDENRSMRVGDTILQQVYLPPLLSFSQKILFGVRVNAIFHEERKIGFSYETLEGHVERGESVFTLEQLGQGVIFRIQTFSEPAGLLAKWTGPFFALPYQKYCTHQALANFKTQIS